MPRSAISLAVCLLILCRIGMAQNNEKDLGSYLNAVTERGRALYAYDQAAWHGTDAWFAVHPDHNGLTNYICEQGPAGWTVLFGGWNSEQNKLLIVYQARESGAPGHFVAQRIDPPREASAAETAMERALELASASFPRPTRPYNSAILPAPDGNLYVYFYPGQTKTDVWPLGGDVRFTISADGKQIIEKRQLHKTVMDMQFDPKLKIVGGIHSHVLTEVPEDTDVLYVLNRRPSIPEYIAAGKYIFAIDTAGSITFKKR